LAGELYAFGADQETGAGPAAGGELVAHSDGALKSDCPQGCCDDPPACTVVACNTGETICPCQTTDNLLSNPGGETAIHGPWVKTTAQDWRQLDVVGADPSAGFDQPGPRTGNWYISGPANSALDEIYQDVDVSAYANRIDAGQYKGESIAYVANDGDPSGTPKDKPRVTVEYRDAGAVVLATWDTDWVELDGGGWFLQSDTRDVPATTRTVRFRLRAERNLGTALNAYFDDLSFKLLCDTSYADCDFDCCWDADDSDAAVSDATLGGNSSAVSVECTPDESSGSYTFSSDFTISNCNLETLKINARFQVRDSVTAIRINGVVTGDTGNVNRPGDVAWHTVQFLLADGLQAGANTIEVDVTPGGGADGPELRWEWTGKEGG